MTPELAILFKATMALTIGLAAVHLGGRARASVRHLVLATTLAVLVVLPLASAVAPALTLAVPMPAEIAPSASGSATPARMPGAATGAEGRRGPAVMAGGAPAALPSGATMLRVIWVSGVVVLLAALGRALWRLSRIRRSSVPWLAAQVTADRLAAGARGGGAAVVIHEAVPAPMTCGWRHPMIVFPPDARRWSGEDVERALVHELEHVRRGDWVVHLLARGVCAAYWCHPLVWVVWRRLCLECERACDDAVVGRMEDTEYASQLVTLAGRLSRTDPLPVLSMARRSDLTVRVKAVLDRTQLRGRASAAAVAAALAAATVLSLVLAPIRVQAVPAGEGQEAQVPGRRSADRPAPRGTALERALVEAADQGSIEDVTALLDAGVDVNAVVRGDGTALLIAAREGDREMVDFLLQRGADVDIGVSGDGSALIMAAREGHAAIVRTLLDRGADVNLGVVGDGNPLIMAAREGHLDILRVLIEHGAFVDEVVAGDENAIISASASGQLEAVRFLVSRGANVNSRVWAEGGFDREGEWRTPLNRARRHGHTEVVRYLQSVGAAE
jgi:ankyrin repeat protein/beta-lactamase regulating signal transducer with metallopeptidase domain